MEPIIKDIPNNEMHIKIWMKFFLTVLGIGILVGGFSSFNVYQSNRHELELRVLDANDNVRLTAQARRDEAKALSDRAMFEEMSKKK